MLWNGRNRTPPLALALVFLLVLPPSIFAAVLKIGFDLNVVQAGDGEWQGKLRVGSTLKIDDDLVVLRERGDLRHPVVRAREPAVQQHHGSPVTATVALPPAGTSTVDEPSVNGPPVPTSARLSRTSAVPLLVSTRSFVVATSVGSCGQS